jgi:hypothetical protein
MRLPARSRLVLAVAPLLAGCNLSPTETACTADIRPAIEVTIRDAGSGEYLAAQATGAVTDGAFRDTLRLSSGRRVDGVMIWQTRSGAAERPGTYRVEVTAPGYAPWVREGVRARDGECHVGTVGLDARLQAVAR